MNRAPVKLAKHSDDNYSEVMFFVTQQYVGLKRLPDFKVK